MTELSEKAGKMLVTEMNDKYPVMVYAMTKAVGVIPPGSKISSCQVRSVTERECELSYVTCRGDACSMPKTATYRFRRPLSGDKIFMLKLQSQICAPKIHWLVTKPLALLILVVCGILTLLAMGLGVDGMTEQLHRMPRLEQGVSAVFGTAHNFAVVILCAWCVAVIAHFLESLVAYRKCERTLRFSNEVSSLWAILIFCVGWPIFVELMELIEWKEIHTKKK